MEEFTKHHDKVESPATIFSQNHVKLRERRKYNMIEALVSSALSSKDSEVRNDDSTVTILFMPYSVILGLIWVHREHKATD